MMLSSSSSSKQDCAICKFQLRKTTKSKKVHTIFTAECSHSFHYHCIASNVKHGNRVCPVCRAIWKQLPFQGMPSQQGHFGSFRLLTNSSRYVLQRFQAQEPSIFDDDEPVINQILEEMHSGNSNSDDAIEIKTYTELPAVPKSEKFDDFGILINLKARKSLNSRTPIDLVTILDISGSMQGSKIALLKEAMDFVVQNLDPLDRLSVISFSDKPHRVFPLRRMTEIGKQESIEMINSLVANGGTNIAEALKKGSKVMTERKFQNPVSAMILLSDGKDYNPLRMLSNTSIPIHTFGFGADHDANLLHSISEQSGGMFSFIEAENVIQDAFAQCIGGLLSVVVQELRVEVECVHPVLRLGSIKAGSYKVGMGGNGRQGFIEVGDLYAEEERDFLVSMDIPAVNDSNYEMPLLKVRAIYKDPIKKKFVTIEGNEATILRPHTVLNRTVSLEVERQRNRFNVASAIADAHVAAEHGNLTEARLMLGGCQRELLLLGPAVGEDECKGLNEELEEMREGMANPVAYGSRGRAYMLSGLDAHSKQRATARGDSTKLGSLKRTYQTADMAKMVKKSQKMANPPPMPPKLIKLEDQSTSSSKRRKL